MSAPAASATASEASGSLSRISTPTGSEPAAAHELARDGRHDGDRLAPGLDAVRLVVLVLDEHAVEPADAVGRELGQRVRDDGRQAGRAGVAGQRRAGGSRRSAASRRGSALGSRACGMVCSGLACPTTPRPTTRSPPASARSPTHRSRVRAARAGGPGGQHVNTTDSAVTISVAVAELALDDAQRARLTDRLRTRITRGRPAQCECPGRAQPAPEPAHRARAARAHDRRGAAAAHAAPADAAGKRRSRAPARRETPDRRAQAHAPRARRRRVARELALGRPARA